MQGREMLTGLYVSELSDLLLFSYLHCFYQSCFSVPIMSWTVVVFCNLCFLGSYGNVVSLWVFVWEDKCSALCSFSERSGLSSGALTLPAHSPPRVRCAQSRFALDTIQTLPDHMNCSQRSYSTQTWYAVLGHRQMWVYPCQDQILTWTVKGSAPTSLHLY